MGHQDNTHLCRIGIPGRGDDGAPVVQVLAAALREQFAVVLH
jgi:hypothetical protein